MSRAPRQRKKPAPIDGRRVRADFNSLDCVVHYTRAAHRLGLWESERGLIERWLPDRAAPLLEAGCGAGRATLGLWELGYRNLTAFDFAEELVEQARALANERGAAAIRFAHADATKADLGKRLANATGAPPLLAERESRDEPAPTVSEFAGVLFLFNGLMQIPLRRRRRKALRTLAAITALGAPLIFTTHDRAQPGELKKWEEETARWANGRQDPRLREFGDRYFAHDHGATFMHLPVREEILADLAATGWRHAFDAMRREIATESRAVKDFSDECRFWIARRA